MRGKNVKLKHLKMKEKVKLKGERRTVEAGDGHTLLIMMAPVVKKKKKLSIHRL